LDVVEALAMREPHIVIHAPGSIWDYHNTAVSPEAARLRTEAFVANVAPAATRAETVGATFVLENIQDPDPAMRRRLVEAVGSPALRLSLDTGHANYGHGRFGTPPPDAFVRDAGNALAHLHLQDTDGYADRHWALGEGNIAWPALFRALRTSTGLGNGGADAPRLIIELADKAGLASSIAHLRALGVAQ
ncbi:MAG: TIM barrel protein, partial [Pseudomonadota bacterium]